VGRLARDVDQKQSFHRRRTAIQGCGRQHLEDAMANAHLISAAPEMYTALKDAVAILKDMGAVGTMMTRFEASLKKAEGPCQHRSRLTKK
jgi:hypothetical protein